MAFHQKSEKTWIKPGNGLLWPASTTNPPPGTAFSLQQNELITLYSLRKAALFANHTPERLALQPGDYRLEKLMNASKQWCILPTTVSPVRRNASQYHWETPAI